MKNKIKIDWTESRNAVFELDTDGAIIFCVHDGRVQVLYSKTLTTEPHPTVPGATEIDFDPVISRWAEAGMASYMFWNWADAQKLGHGKCKVLEALNRTRLRPKGEVVRSKVPWSALKKLLDAVQAVGEADGTMAAIRAENPHPKEALAA